tara:strand:- start:91355 stop:91801 length:447 start_codon:yes stop_codon:yes gene_type:complete
MKYTYLVLLAFLLSGCVTGNYQSYSSGVGYQFEQQDGDSYYVAYTGSVRSEIEKINDFALLRSAELTLEKGFNYFVINEAKNNKAELEKPLPSEVLIDNSLRGSISEPRPKSELAIVLFHDKPDGIFYDARVVEKALKEEYEISEPSS